MSKSVAKANLGKAGMTSLGDRLDRAVRAGQEGQTKGIPVGPDTSLLIAELIMAEVDAQVQSAMPDSVRSCTRFMDDLTFYAPTRLEAEALLLAWDRALSTYDLGLSPTKTTIVEGPITPEKPWRASLSQFELRQDTDRIESNDLQSFFSLAFDVHAQYPTDYVLSYAIRRVRPRPKGRRAWQAFTQLCLAASIADPSCLKSVAGVFREARAAGIPVDAVSLERAMNEMCAYHAPFEHGSEVAWSLSIIREHDLAVSSEAARLVSNMEDNSSLLLLWDLDRLGRVEGGADMNAAAIRATHPDAWKSADWLLAYEAARHGWSSDAELRKQPQWKELLDLGVAFLLDFAPTTPAPTTPAPATPAPTTPAPTTPAPDRSGGGENEADVELDGEADQEADEDGEY